MERTLYTLLAPIYDALVPYVSSRARRLGRSWLDVSDGDWVLDVGTGTGLTLFPVAVSNPSGWTEGLDCTSAMLNRAQHRMQRCSHSRYGLRQGTATRLPYPENSFDAVYTSYLLGVLSPSHRHRSLRECRRVLRPRGRLVTVTLAPPHQRIEQLWKRLAEHLPFLLGGAEPFPVSPLLRATGFRIEAHTTTRQAGLRSSIVRARPAPPPPYHGA